MNLSQLDNRWFALQVRNRHENACAQGLESKGYEVFLPVCRFGSYSKPSPSPPILQPLFPGYLFCRFNSKASGLLLTTPGVIRVVGYGGIPSEIYNEEILNIRRLIETKRSLAGVPYLKEGERVRIKSGPLIGLEGILITRRNSRKLVLSIDAVYRSVAVEITEACVAVTCP